jgi:hypothetical protein
LIAFAALATLAIASPAMAGHSVARPHAARGGHANPAASTFQNLTRSVRLQQRISLLTVKQSAISQLGSLNFARNHGLISFSTYVADRAQLISNFHLAYNEMRGLIAQENFSLQTLSVEVRTGQISVAQFQMQATQVISASHASQLALIAKVQQGLINPATPFT